MASVPALTDKKKPERAARDYLDPGLAGFSVHYYGSYYELLRRDRPSGTH